MTLFTTPAAATGDGLGRVVIDVYGVPIPQGSKTGFVVNGRAVVAPAGTAKSRAAHKSWRQLVADAAQQWCLDHGAPAATDLPVKATVVFFLPRPSSAPRRVVLPAKKPDIDKLVRSVLDAITGVLITNDSRVCDLRAIKQFAVGRPAGCTITLEALT